MRSILSITSSQLATSKDFLAVLSDLGAHNPPPLPTVSAELFDTARTHTSWCGYPRDALEDKPENLGNDYERLEFLGDTILSTAATLLIWKHYPCLTEGAMTVRSPLSH